MRRPVVAIVAHARQVPAPERELFASGLQAHLGTRALIVKTCHRVEAYTTVADAADSAAVATAAAAVPEGGRVLEGEAAVRHIVAVATGRDSVVIGEDQILHQLREALEAARTENALDTDVDRLFGLALRAGRKARSWRSGPRRSLADVALDRVEAMTGGSVCDTEILVVGAGRMGDLLARAGMARGASVTIANRSADRARAVAAACGGTTSALDPGPRARRFAAIFVALAGPWIIEDATMAAILDRLPAIVDLSVPEAVPARLVERLGGAFVTADDLALAEVEEAVPDPRTEGLIDETVRAFLEWQARGDARAAADALVRRADLEREAELAALWRKLPSLDPEAREAIEGMTRHLAARLLRQPLERLGRDADGVEGRSVRDLFAL